MPTPTPQQRDQLLDLVPSDRDALERVFELATRAYLSPLTGLPNRAAYDVTAEHYDRILLAERVVVFLDLTGFKAVNDGHGHAAGDACIAEAGRLLMGVSEANKALPFHYGGDEFLALVVPASLAAFQSAFLGALAAFTVQWRDSALTVQTTAGVSNADKGVTLEQLRERAEKACKTGKHRGDPWMQWTVDLAAASPAATRWRCAVCFSSVDVKAGDGVGRGRTLNCAVCSHPGPALT